MALGLATDDAIRPDHLRVDPAAVFAGHIERHRASVTAGLDTLHDVVRGEPGVDRDICGHRRSAKVPGEVLDRPC